MVGTSHFVSRSSLLWDWLSSLAFPSSKGRMAWGEAQALIPAASGWVRSFPVFLLNSFRVFSKFGWKFGVDEEDAWRLNYVVPIVRDQKRLWVKVRRDKLPSAWTCALPHQSPVLQRRLLSYPGRIFPPAMPGTSASAPFDTRNYIPQSSTAPFDARDY